MNRNPFPQNVGPDLDLVSINEALQNVEPDQHDIHIADGGEFLDDALRMKEQPFEEVVMKKDE